MNKYKDLIDAEYEQLPLNITDFPKSIESLIELTPKEISHNILQLRENLLKIVINSKDLTQSSKMQIIRAAAYNPKKTFHGIIQVICMLWMLASFLTLPELYRIMPDSMRSKDGMIQLYIYCMQMMIVLLIPAILSNISSKSEKLHQQQKRDIDNDQEKFELWLSKVSHQIEGYVQESLSITTMNDDASHDLETSMPSGRISP